MTTVQPLKTMTPELLEKYPALLRMGHRFETSIGQRLVVDGFYGGLTGLAVSELLGSEDDVSEDELDALEELVRRRRAEKSG